MLTKNDCIQIHRLLTSDKVTYLGNELPVIYGILSRMDEHIKSFDADKTPARIDEVQ